MNCINVKWQNFIRNRENLYDQVGRALYEFIGKLFSNEKTNYVIDPRMSNVYTNMSHWLINS